MHDGDSENETRVDLTRSSYNPYEDTALREVQPDVPIVEDKEPFNDVIKHGDIVVGYRRNRTLSDYPKRARPWVRLYSIIAVIVIIGGILWDFLQ